MPVQTKKSNKNPFSFGASMVAGLPDRDMLDDSGQSNQAVLRQRLQVSKTEIPKRYAFFKELARNGKTELPDPSFDNGKFPFIDFYANPNLRFLMLLRHLKFLAGDSEVKGNSRWMQPSYEIAVLQSINQGFPFAMKAKRSTLPIPPSLTRALPEDMVQVVWNALCAIEKYLQRQLRDFDALSEDEKEKVAVGIFAVNLPFMSSDTRLFAKLIRDFPVLKRYYGAILNHPDNHWLIEQIGSDAEEKAPFDTIMDGYGFLQNYLKSLTQDSDHREASAKIADIAERLVALANRVDERDRLQTLLVRWSRCLISKGQAVYQEPLESDMLEKVTLSWSQWLLSWEDLDGLNLQSLYEGRLQDLATLQAQIKNVLQTLTKAKEALTQHQASTSNASSLQGVLNRTQEARLSQAVSTAELDLATLRLAVLMTLLPADADESFLVREASEWVIPDATDAQSKPLADKLAHCLTEIETREANGSLTVAESTDEVADENTAAPEAREEPETTDDKESLPGKQQLDNPKDTVSVALAASQERDPLEREADEWLDNGDEVTVADAIAGTNEPTETTLVIESAGAESVASAPATVQATQSPADTVSSPALKPPARKGPVDEPAKPMPKYGAGCPELQYDRQVPCLIEGIPGIQQRYNQAWTRQSSIPGYLIDSAALNLLESQKIIPAYWVLKTAETANIQSDDSLPSLLLLAAYYGQHVWNQNGPIYRESQNLLSQLPISKVHELIEHRPGGKTVAYLLMVATLQPAIFGGNLTTAPQLLSDLLGRFSPVTDSLIRDILEICNRGETLKMAALRRQPENSQDSLKGLQKNLKIWSDRIRHAKGGWAPIRKALRNCLEHGNFTEAVNVILQDRQGERAKLEQFVSQYSSLEAIDVLMDAEVARIVSPVGPRTEGNARDVFRRSTDELLTMCQQWLDMRGQSTGRGAHITQFVSRFTTLRKQVRDHFAGLVEANGFEQRTGAQLVVSMLENLGRAIDDEKGAIWDDARVMAHRDYPHDLVSADETSEDLIGRHLNMIDLLPVFYDDEALITYARKREQYHIEYLIRLRQQDKNLSVNNELDELKRLRGAQSHDLMKRCDRLLSYISSAHLVSFINEETYHQLQSEVEYLQETIKGSSLVDSHSKLEKQVALLEGRVEGLMAGKLSELREAYETALKNQLARHGDDGVSAKWMENWDKAEQAGNIPVMEELLESLEKALQEGERLDVMAPVDPGVLQDFLRIEPTISQFLKQHHNAREIYREIASLGHPALDLGQAGAGFKHILQDFADMRDKRPMARLGQENYDPLVRILTFLGFYPTETTFKKINQFDYRYTDRMMSLTIPVKASRAPRPFPVFGELHRDGNYLAVIVCYSAWSVEQFDKLIESHALGNKTPVVLSAYPLSISERNHFATYCADHQRSIFLCDLSMMLFLGGLAQADNAAETLKKFLWLSTPWTYYNPYSGHSAMKPPDVEMRYGRTNDINALTNMQNGAAIIFGGRQLGKSTILREVERQFHRPDNHRLAFYNQEDKDLFHYDKPEKKFWEEARHRVWRQIRDNLTGANVPLPPSHDAGYEGIRNQVQQFLSTHPDYQVIIIFDEVDSLLALDHAGDFAIFKGLREMVNKFHGRFKIIIAGLQNVKRFENTPNYPLSQLGGTRQVSIMSTKDALQLVTEPLAAMGYTFEEENNANIILTITNRHPGMLQMFCHCLVEYLRKQRMKVPVGQYKITAADVSHIENQAELRQMIEHRFELTINLDTRYKVIVYSLIVAEMANRRFSSQEAKTCAGDWLPEFQSLSTRQFEAFLNELVGLGVLRKSVEDQHYVLRNSNIHRLLTIKDCEPKLERALEEVSRDDPLECHGFITPLHTTTPLTFRDHQALTGSDADGRESQNDTVDATRYTVSLIAGSDALGLGQLEEVMPYLFKEEASRFHTDLDHYTILKKQSSDFKNINQFESNLRGIIEKRSTAEPILLLIHVLPDTDNKDVLNLLDAAHAWQTSVKKLKFPVRVVLVLSPPNLYKWKLDSQFTAARESLQPFLMLKQWHKHAFYYLLERLDMAPHSDNVDDLEKLTQGWSLPIHLFCLTKHRDAPAATEVRQVPRMIPLPELGPKEARAFLKAAGVNELPHAETILRCLAKEGPMGSDMLQLELEAHLEEVPSLLVLDSLLETMVALKLLNRCVQRKPDESLEYEVPLTIASLIAKVDPLNG